jgi:hypothetical protein
MNGALRLAEGLTLALAAKRLTRLVTTDWIGEWLLVRPLKNWSLRHDGPIDVHMETVRQMDGTVIDLTKGAWRTKATSGLDCDWCVGVWAAAIVALPMPRAINAVRQPLLKVLAVSQLVGMLAEREAAAATSRDDLDSPE